MARKVAIPTVLLTTAAMFVFLRFYVWTAYPQQTDHANHLSLIERGLIPTYPLYHWTVLLFSLGRAHFYRPAAAVALTLATAATTALSAAYLLHRSRRPIWCVTAVCVGLAVVMPLPKWIWLLQLFGAAPSSDEGLYIGQISPNVWHNPTTIFAMPFAIALFWCATCVLEHFTLRSALALGFMLALSAFAKPNYVLALAPCLALALAMQRMPLADKVLQLVAAFLPPLLLLYGQATWFIDPKGGHAADLILFEPLTVWEFYSRNITYSAFAGIAFPLAVLLAYRGEFSAETPLKLAWATLGMATFQFVMLKEAGEGGVAGNWSWALIFSDHILFLVSCEYLIRQPRDWRKVFCFGCFLLHVACGSICVAQCMQDPIRALYH
jgi:hypothetical protein